MVGFIKAAEADEVAVPGCGDVLSLIRKLPSNCGSQAGTELEFVWNFWLRNELDGMCVDLGEFSTVPGFKALWGAVDAMMIPPPGIRIGMFRKKAKPMETDKYSKIGGKWVAHSKTDDLSLWYSLVLAVVTGRLISDNHASSVIGVCLTDNMTVEMWLDGGYIAADPCEPEVVFDKNVFDKQITSILEQEDFTTIPQFTYQSHGRENFVKTDDGIFKPKRTHAASLSDAPTRITFGTADVTPPSKPIKPDGPAATTTSTAPANDPPPRAAMHTKQYSAFPERPFGTALVSVEDERARKEEIRKKRAEAEVKKLETQAVIDQIVAGIRKLAKIAQQFDKFKQQQKELEAKDEETVLETSQSWADDEDCYTQSAVEEISIYQRKLDDCLSPTLDFANSLLKEVQTATTTYYNDANRVRDTCCDLLTAKRFAELQAKQRVEQERRQEAEKEITRKKQASMALRTIVSQTQKAILERKEEQVAAKKAKKKAKEKERRQRQAIERAKERGDTPREPEGEKQPEGPIVSAIAASGHTNANLTVKFSLPDGSSPKFVGESIEKSAPKPAPKSKKSAASAPTPTPTPTAALNYAKAASKPAPKPAAKTTSDSTAPAISGKKEPATEKAKPKPSKKKSAPVEVDSNKKLIHERLQAQLRESAKKEKAERKRLENASRRQDKARLAINDSETKSRDEFFGEFLEAYDEFRKELLGGMETVREQERVAGIRREEEAKERAEKRERDAKERAIKEAVGGCEREENLVRIQFEYDFGQSVSALRHEERLLVKMFADEQVVLKRAAEAAAVVEKKRLEKEAKLREQEERRKRREERTRKQHQEILKSFESTNNVTSLVNKCKPTVFAAIEEEQDDYEEPPEAVKKAAKKKKSKKSKKEEPEPVPEPEPELPESGLDAGIEDSPVEAPKKKKKKKPGKNKKPKRQSKQPEFRSCLLDSDSEKEKNTEEEEQQETSPISKTLNYIISDNSRMVAVSKVAVVVLIIAFVLAHLFNI